VEEIATNKYVFASDSEAIPYMLVAYFSIGDCFVPRNDARGGVAKEAITKQHQNKSVNSNSDNSGSDKKFWFRQLFSGSDNYCIFNCQLNYN
jgi:hypothetical protein